MINPEPQHGSRMAPGSPCAPRWILLPAGHPRGTCRASSSQGCRDQLLLFPLHTNPHLSRAVLPLGPGWEQGCSSSTLQMLQGQLSPRAAPAHHLTHRTPQHSSPTCQPTCLSHSAAAQNGQGWDTTCLCEPRHLPCPGHGAQVGHQQEFPHERVVRQ